MTLEWLPQIDRAKCNSCGDCIAQCPTDALGWQDNEATLPHPDLCIYCATCEEICPVNAIELPFLIVKIEEQGE